MRTLRIGVWIAIVLFVWVGLNIGMTLWGDGFFYRVLSPMPVLRQSDGHVDFYCWYWTRFRMNIMSAKLLECGGRTTGFAPNEAELPGGIVETEWRWPIPPGKNGSCILKGAVSYSPFGPFGAKMTSRWQSDPFVPLE